MSRRRQTTVTGPLVVCAGGPLHGRWYRKGDWDTAIAAARAMGYPPGHPAAAALGYAPTTPARHEPHPWLLVPDGTHADGHVHTWQHPTAPADVPAPSDRWRATPASLAPARLAAGSDGGVVAGRGGCQDAGCVAPGGLPRCALCPHSPTYRRRRPAPAKPRNRTPCDLRRGAA
jgi:hypothetical protein